MRRLNAKMVITVTKIKVILVVILYKITRIAYY
jgi:hypothetical protein